MRWFLRNEGSRWNTGLPQRPTAASGLEEAVTREIYVRGPGTGRAVRPFSGDRSVATFAVGDAGTT